MDRTSQIRSVVGKWLWLLLLVPVALGALRLRFDVEVLNLLPREPRPVQGLILYQQHFADGRELTLTLRGPDAEITEAAAQAAAQVLNHSPHLVAQAFWQQPFMEHPQQAAELAGFLWFNQPPEVFGTLTNRLLGTHTLATLSAAREELTTSLSPLVIGQLSRDPFSLLQFPEGAGTSGLIQQSQDPFSSPDGTFRLVFARAARELGNYRAARAWLDGVQARVAEAQERGQIPASVTVGYTGSPAFVAEIAEGMQRDISISIASTLVIIVLLFLWAHRSWRPLLWLVTLLGLILAGTFFLGGLLLGTLNVVSAGFAAILLGLAVDYGLVLYQEHRVAPMESGSGLRRPAARGIIWSASTSAAAFLMLNFGGLPGLGQLGTLVAVGVCLAAVVMLFAFLPPLRRHGIQPSLDAPAAANGRGRTLWPAWAIWGLTGSVVLAAAGVLLWRPPSIDDSPDPLRPRQSGAYRAIDEIQDEMGQNNDPIWLLVAGANERQVAERLDKVLITLKRAQASGALERFTLPVGLWPDPRHQIANRQTARQLLAAREDLRQATLSDGFTPEAFAVTDAVFDTWERALSLAPEVFWPGNVTSQWLLGKFAARTAEHFLALGYLYPGSEAETRVLTEELNRDLPEEGIWLAGWDLLGWAVLDVVERDLLRVLLPIGIILLVGLRLAFGRSAEVMLSLGTLALSGVCLLAVMSLAGWSWNLLNLMAVPLLIGAGVDYTIHMQLALRRYAGNTLMVRRIIGRALLLCAGSTVAGFGSLAWSSNAGLASLGAVCATGVALTFLISVGLLPGWWASAVGDGEGAVAGPVPALLAQPSWFYRTALWKLGCWAASRLPDSLVSSILLLLADVYWRLNRRRRDVVIGNLLPALDGEAHTAQRLSRELFRNFARKLADLWRYESGLPIEHLVCELAGWEHFLAAKSRGRGLLLLTPHLGNWEFGAPLLAARGFKVLVLTLSEPDPGLTELRQASRSRWGIETLVIGQDPFAFVEVIRRLEAGAIVALLIDRPPPSSAARVNLFGHPFPASLAAAELARATGCVLLPVHLPRNPAGYRAQVLPEIPYDRAALGSRQAREQLTQQIMRAFEPFIREYLAQWYHFVPVWPGTEEKGSPPRPAGKEI